MFAFWFIIKLAYLLIPGKNYFVYTNNGLQNQFVLNILSDLKGEPKSFLDPNKMSADGTVNISAVTASHNGKNLAYTMSKAGSDWEEIHVINIETGFQFNDKLEYVKFSGIEWQGPGFYYSRYDAPDSSNLLKGKNEFHKVSHNILH